MVARMRVVIVTGTQPHHKNLCGAITSAFNVVAIIHPAEAASSAAVRGRRLLRQGRTHGWPLAIMRVLGEVSSRRKARAGCVEGPSTSPTGFSEGIEAYQRIPRSLIRTNCDVRDSRSHEFLRSLRPDVTLCLGGPVYPTAFIDASPLTLNFHSGVSPIYNGAASIQFAFANGHPHLCGGTVMMMSGEVDGGGILGHYLPAIDRGDSPDSLFSKTVRGASVMYARILEYVQTGTGVVQYVPQAPPLFYTRGFQLGWYQSAMITQNRSSDISARFQRKESFVEYWREPCQAAARAALQSTLESLLWNAGQAQSR